jgi:hypothetical protein
MTMSEWFMTGESIQSTEPQCPEFDWSPRALAAHSAKGETLAEWYLWAKSIDVFQPEAPR